MDIGYGLMRFIFAFYNTYSRTLGAFALARSILCVRMSRIIFYSYMLLSKSMIRFIYLLKQQLITLEEIMKTNILSIFKSVSCSVYFNVITKNNMKTQRSKQRGMTFIEVLVAFVIIVTGILGSVAMQATAKKASFDAMQRSLASSLAQDIIERMRNNDSATLAGYANLDYGVTLDGEPATRCDTFDALCTPAEMIINDVYEWELALMGADVLLDGSSAGGLIGGRACISTNANTVTIVVSWQGRTEIADAGAGAIATCGGAGVDTKRRQIIVRAFIF